MIGTIFEKNSTLSSIRESFWLKIRGKVKRKKKIEKEKGKEHLLDIAVDKQRGNIVQNSKQ